MKTFRGRLALLIGAVIGIGLILFGAVVIMVGQQRSIAGIDQRLLQRAEGPSRRGGQFPRGLRRGGQQGLPPGLTDQERGLVRLNRPIVLDQQGRSTDGSDDPPFSQSAFEKSLKGERVAEESEMNGEPIRVASVPWRERGEIAGVVQTAQPIGELKQTWSAQWMVLLFMLPLAIVAGVGGGLLLARGVVRPVDRMREAAEKMTATDLSARLPVQGDDELAKLAKAFNAMTERLDESFQAEHEALEAQRRFTADASHELRTPVTRIQLVSANALDGSQEEMREALQLNERAAGDMGRLIDHLLILARADASQLSLATQTVSVQETVERAAEIAGLKDDPRLTISGDARVEADPDALRRVVRNLLENASRHCPEGAIRVSIKPGDQASISIADEGEGIAREHLPELGKRFYRADASRTRSSGGTGLGLSIVDALVRGMGGTWSVESKQGEGTTVKLTLPAAR